jgi:hypothetical protein
MISTRFVLFGFAVVSIGLLSGSLQHAAAQSAEEAVRASKKYRGALKEKFTELLPE